MSQKRAIKQEKSAKQKESTPQPYMQAVEGEMYVPVEEVSDAAATIHLMLQDAWKHDRGPTLTVIGDHTYISTADMKMWLAHLMALGLSRRHRLRGATPPTHRSFEPRPQ